MGTRFFFIICLLFIFNSCRNIKKTELNKLEDVFIATQNQTKGNVHFQNSSQELIYLDNYDERISFGVVMGNDADLSGQIELISILSHREKTDLFESLFSAESQEGIDSSVKYRTVPYGENNLIFNLPDGNQNLLFHRCDVLVIFELRASGNYSIEDFQNLFIDLDREFKERCD